MLRVFLLMAFLGLSVNAKPYILGLSKAQPAQEVSTNYRTNDHQNFYEIQLIEESLMENKQLYLIFESENPNFKVSILTEEGKRDIKLNTLIDLTTFSGSLAMVMSDTFFNGNLNYFKDSGSLKFVVSNHSNDGNMDYKLKVEIGERMQASMGRIYTTRIDAMIEELKVNLSYTGSEYPELQKLRFQLTTVKYKQNYTLEATLNHLSNVFQLNNVFQRSVGGILSLPDLPVCKEGTCNYELDIILNNVKVLNIESFMINQIERLSINHYEEYYDKVYQENALTTYELPFIPEMSGMDVSINLIPVIGSSGLYVNPQTLPLSLDKYMWQEKGSLAKRITIKWEELVEMKADGSSLFISVATSQPGEFLIKLDAHEPGFKGRLNPGIIEAGFVKYEEISNYLYMFEVFETQDITFDLRMNVFSGSADLYVKQCHSYKDCKIEEANLADDNVLKVENNQSEKTIRHSFTCEYRKKNAATLCEFVIGVKGKENHGTHYDLTLHEADFHRLMIPGHSISINSTAGEIVYLKFSYPSKLESNAKLYLSIEPIWGDFAVAVSKNNKYPTETDAEYKETFLTRKTGLIQSLKNIEIKPDMFADYSVQGIYYLAVKAQTSCALNIKFHEKSKKDTTIHTLTAGNQVRGEITKADEVIYYTMKISLDRVQASTVNINLTPLKGKYVMFVSRTGKLPTRKNNELISENNHLEFLYKDYSESNDEYIIGVQLLDEESMKNDSNQYIINFNYANKPMMLTPGIISTFTVQEANVYLIQILEEMDDLLLLKSIVDGHNLDLCASFTANDIATDTTCDYEVKNRRVSLYIKGKDLKEKCASFKEKYNKCYLQVTIKGNQDQKFSIGYTFNDHAFQLVKGSVVNGPRIISGKHKLHFIYHAEPEKPIGIYLNTKGSHLNIYSKIIDGNNVDSESALIFPEADDYDKENLSSKGHITNIFYGESKVASYGNSPEVLITIEAEHPYDKAEPFDSSRAFVLQVASDSLEIIRTQTLNEMAQPEAWNYYNFYNNGNSDEIRIYVSSNISTQLEVLVSRNIHSRPPFTNKPLIRKLGIGSVDLSIKKDDMKFDSTQSNHSLKGHFTLAVKSTDLGMISVFWNNKENLNYLELTPGEPTLMQVEENKNLYFSFFAQDADSVSESDRGDVEIYIKSSVQANVYILKTNDTSLDAPSRENHSWKRSLGHAGGIVSIKISPNDPNYCMDCTYIGYIEANEKGNVSIIANIEHHNIPILLSPGFAFPIQLEANQSKVFRLFNPDNDLADIIVSMLTGFVDVYVSADEKVSQEHYKDSYSLEKNLDTHKFIVIAPFRYEVNAPHDFYIMVNNNRKEPASFTITFEKNMMKTPIEPGITKFIHLAPGESNNMFYKPRAEENILTVEVELRQVLDHTFIPQALSLMNQYLEIYHHSENGSRYMLKYKSKSVQGNRVYIVFDIKENTEGTFSVHVYNPVGSGVYLSVFLSSGGYKLVHLNDFSTHIIEGDAPQVFEAHGIDEKNLFFDLKVCKGDVKVDLYQTDYDKVLNNETAEHKTIKNSNSLIHYVKLENKRAFLKVTNQSPDFSVYEMSVTQEKDIENNPYSEIAQGNGGKVSVETDNSVLRMHPVSIKSTYSENFKHRVTYTAYLSDDTEVLKYAKNCGDYKIEHAFPEYHLSIFSKVVELGTAEDTSSNAGQIKIPMEGLEPSTKYYGIVAAKIELIPIEEGYISSSRSGVTYYDEFVFMTPKYKIPFFYMITVLALLGFFFVLFCIIKACVFGRMNKLQGMERLSDMAAFDDGILGHNIMSMLENEYFDDVPPANLDDHSDDKNSDNETKDPVQMENGEEGNGGEIELTDNDRDKPLDA